MTYWDKIINQNKIDSALISELSDISYAATKGRREKGRNFNNGIVSLGTLPFIENPPQNLITKEMISDYHQSLQEERIKEQLYPLSLVAVIALSKPRIDCSKLIHFEGSF